MKVLLFLFVATIAFAEQPKLEEMMPGIMAKDILARAKVKAQEIQRKLNGIEIEMEDLQSVLKRSQSENLKKKLEQLETERKPLVQSLEKLQAKDIDKLLESENLTAKVVAEQVKILGERLKAQGLLTKVVELGTGISNQRLAILTAERHADSLVLGEYVKTKMQRMLNSVDFCNAANSCRNRNETGKDIYNLEDVFYGENATKIKRFEFKKQGAWGEGHLEEVKD